MTLTIAGAGAFGTALAISLSANGPVRLFARDAETVAHIRLSRQSPRLPGVTLPDTVEATDDRAALSAETVLLAIPAQALRAFLADLPADPAPRHLVACCKGIDLETLTGPTGMISAAWPNSTAAVLTGPSFASDIARGLPTALVLACADDAIGQELQAALATPTLRIYRTTDTIGAELGGALKNVIAIACGAAIGAGYGESARAAIMTRGFAEMRRLAARLDANPETLTGLSGLGDLALTCTSDQSRNYRYGYALGKGEDFGTGTTVEGVASAKAVSDLARKLDLDLPVCTAVAQVVTRELTLGDALQALLNRPLKEE